ncbi:MAG: PPK2 family polyphosphate kinase [Chthonomonadales bacterium]
MAHAIEVDGSSKFSLQKIDPSDHGKIEKEEAEERLVELGKKFYDLMDLMFASGSESLLIVLQGRDTSGKDGLIRDIMGHVNAQSVHAIPFKVPTEDEAAHDFLWRIHKEVPSKGHTSIFNRSHYEDVLVVRVHGLVPKSVWSERYKQINQFEELVQSNGTIIQKFYLHISKDEQEERLRAREADPAKAWKLAVGDWKEREFWDDYTEAYEDAISKCATKDNPWYVVPANHKWYRSFVVMEQLVKALSPFEDRWQEELKAKREVAMKEIEAFRTK